MLCTMPRSPSTSVSVARLLHVLIAVVILPLVTSQLNAPACAPAVMAGVNCGTPPASTSEADCQAESCCLDAAGICRATDPALFCGILGGLPLVIRTACVGGGASPGNQDQTMCGNIPSGCCFDANNDPNCFDDAPIITDMCDMIQLRLRISCGDSLDMRACESRHCCYDGVKMGNYPRCFWPCPSGEPDCAATTNRIDCGFHHITEEECQERLCIFDDDTADIPFCSEGPAKGTVLTPAMCTALAILPDDRDDCGYAGISQTTCVRRGCCYEEAASGPWCYKPVARTIVGDCVVGTSTRFDCGEPGISQRRCEARSCCWDESVGDNGQPWCYDMIRLPATTCIGISVPSRVECGFPGIPQDQCEGRGCCYMTTPPNTIWCFEATAREPACDLNTQNECGFPGITAIQCRARHCCFDVHGSQPQCFRKP